jgi:class 3 adenylate cyclase
MLEAIAERTAATPSPTPGEPKVQDTAERRQVTVMFSDLVSSTALSARLDPEDLREVISGYHKCVAQVVQRLDDSATSVWLLPASSRAARARAPTCWSMTVGFLGT